MDKKKIGIIAGAAVVVIARVVGLIWFLNRSNEKQLNANFTKLGKQFYEEFYYPSQEKSQEDVKAFVKKFEKTGIKINLENIAKISKVDKNLVDSMVNKKTKEKCDAKQSTVTIYPEKPYGKSNYKIEVNLECGFKK